VIIMG